MPTKDNLKHTVETLPVKFETPVVSAMYEYPHIVSLDAREKSKLLKGKMKFDGESSLPKFPITGIGLRGITRSMKSSTLKEPVHTQDLSFIEILSEEEDYRSVEVSS